eukprot:4424599-Amphidinium_carterae.1
MAEIKQRKGVQPRPSMNWTRSLKVMQRELREPALLPAVEEAQTEAPTIKRSDSIGTKLFAGGLSFLINKAKTARARDLFKETFYFIAETSCNIFASCCSWQPTVLVACCNASEDFRPDNRPSALARASPPPSRLSA